MVAGEGFEFAALPALVGSNDRGYGALSILETVRVEEALKDLKADNTVRCYRSQWGRWREWAELKGFNPLPAVAESVALWLTFLHDNGAAVSSMRCSLAAIAYVHRLGGFDNPGEDVLVKRTCQGLARNGKPVRQVAALLSDDLFAIRATAKVPRVGRGGRLEGAELAEARGLVDIALCFTMRDGGLRRSEAAALVWGDLDLVSDGSGRLTVQRSKTDQFGAGSVVALSSFCVDALDSIRPGFGAVGGSIFGMCDRQIGRRVAAAAAAAGLVGWYCGHSGRVGLARAMSSNGAPVNVLMQQGRWRQVGMVTRYTRAESAGVALRWIF